MGDNRREKPEYIVYIYEIVKESIKRVKCKSTIIKRVPSRFRGRTLYTGLYFLREALMRLKYS